MGDSTDDTVLELRWPHKDSRLLYTFTDDGRPRPHFTDLGVPEPRVLLELGQFGDEVGKEWSEEANLLIRGDNLLALKSLAPTYAGKVKLIYIDPPFNTGIAFDEYDDGLEHSTWLTMMRDRLELLRDLLARDGSIWVEIDDTELGYLNVLMDEIFGRANRITTVTVKRSAGTGHKAINPGPINVTDYLLGYARDRGRWAYRSQLVLRAGYDKNYNKWISNVDSRPEEWLLENLADAYARDAGHASAAAGRRAMGAAAFKEAMYRFAIANASQVVRTALPNYEGVSVAAREAIDRSREDAVVHHLARDAHSDMFFWKGNRLLFLADRIRTDPAEEVEADEGETGAEPPADQPEGAAAEGGDADSDEGAIFAEKLTNFWDDIPWQGIAREGGVRFPKNKKPERLLQRIIALATDRNDIVLDSFAGSGTTGAVAHKMRRRWIMVELGEHADTLALPRLRAVVAGTDRTGVTKVEGWQGGGGFRYATLAEAFTVQEPELGLIVVNPEYTNGLLISAVCLREGFTPTGDPVLHGRGGERTYAHVTEEFVTSDYLQTVLSQAPEGGVVTVYCLAHDADIELPEGVIVRRLPYELANRYVEPVLAGG